MQDLKVSLVSSNARLLEIYKIIKMLFSYARFLSSLIKVFHCLGIKLLKNSV